MPEYLGSPDSVKRSSRVDAKDIGFTTDQELNSWLMDVLKKMTDLIQKDRNQNYLSMEENIPQGIHHIANEMAANYITLIQSRRGSPIVRIDDYQVKVNDAEIFTQSIKEALRRFPRKSQISLYTTPKADKDNGS